MGFGLSCRLWQLPLPHPCLRLILTQPPILLCSSLCLCFCLSLCLYLFLFSLLSCLSLCVTLSLCVSVYLCESVFIFHSPLLPVYLYLFVLLHLLIVFVLIFSASTGIASDSIMSRWTTDRSVRQELTRRMDIGRTVDSLAPPDLSTITGWRW